MSPVRREYPEAPIVAVGAVIIDDGHVLLVRRGQQPLQGEWSIPGGALELGETLEAATCREVLEETGLTVKTLALVEILDRIVFSREELPSPEPRLSEDDRREVVPGMRAGRVRYHYVLVDFLCAVTGGSLRCASDATEARWATQDEISAAGVFHLAPATVEVLLKAFRLLAVAERGAGISRWIEQPSD